jgi:hypothetical protein
MIENLRAIFEENNVLRRVDKDLRSRILSTIVRADSITWVSKSKEGIELVSIIGSFTVTVMCNLCKKVLCPR